MTAPQDVYEPLPLYRDVFRESFRNNAEEFFGALKDRSGIDTDANAKTAAETREAEARLAGEESARAAWGWGIGFSVAALAAAVLGAGSVISDDGDPGVLAAIAVGAILVLWFMIGLCIPRRRAHADAANAERARVEELKALAWSQMAPLNALFDWDAPARIIGKTVPALKFDPFFTEGRLAELHDSFGWDDSFNDGKSVLGAHSGEINGNPFVFARLLQMGWGLKIYSGSRTVSWTELERGADGKMRMVHRSQTLTATVSKPIPEYSEDVILIYGNDAAPNLCFTREPSSLSSAGDGFFGRLRKNGAIKSLERFSRNLDDEYGYTIMGNREFEALFETKDRSDEVEYRLLFTPLAQKQMLELIKDREIGFGDDFSFEKRRKINIIRADHLRQADLDTDPAKFADFDFQAAHGKFVGFCEQFFKSTWFALAPLLSIPLYSQTRTHENIYKGIIDRRSCFWEHESLANYLGEKRFRHPDSVTRNILKTRIANRDGDVATLEVTASGFRTVRRVDAVSVTANNGRSYLVEVPWDEYLPVSRTSPVHATEREGLSLTEFRTALQTSEDWQAFFRNWNADSARAAFRRSIVSF